MLQNHSGKPRTRLGINFQVIEKWRALVNAVMNLRIPLNVGKLLTSWEAVSLSLRALLNGIMKYHTEG